jgi:hypothetical protein
VSRLGLLLNRGLRSTETGEKSAVSLAVVGFMNDVAWCDLLAPEVKERLNGEALKLGQAFEQNRET